MSGKHAAVVLLLAALAASGLAGCRKEEPATTPAERRERESAPAVAAAGSVEAAMPRTAPPAETDAIDADHLARAQEDINSGLVFLLTQRNADGGWGFAPGESHPALTALVLKALLRHPDYGIDSPVAVRGFACLMKAPSPTAAFTTPGRATRITPRPWR